MEPGAGCLIEQSVNATLSKTFEVAEALVLAHLQEATLADLTSDVGHRWQKSKGQEEHKHAV